MDTKMLRNIQEFSRDIEQLQVLINRLSRFIRIKIEVEELEDSGFKVTQSLSPEAKKSVSETIRDAIRQKGQASMPEIYQYFQGQGWDVDRNRKNAIRSVMSMLKKKGKVEGNSQVGYRFKDPTERREGTP